jgi:ankyrin repeat protein
MRQRRKNNLAKVAAQTQDPRGPPALGDPLQKFIELGFIRDDEGGSKTEPDTDSMMTHIIQCLWALGKYKLKTRKCEGFKAKVFRATASRMITAMDDSLSTVVAKLYNFPAISSTCEKSYPLSPPDAGNLELIADEVQESYHDILCTNGSIAELSWLPLLISMAMNESPENLFETVYKVINVPDDADSTNSFSDDDDDDDDDETVHVADDDEEQGLELTCISMVIMSKKISVENKLMLLHMIRSLCPWLFFLKNEGVGSPLHHAAKSKQIELLKFILDTNPETAIWLDQMNRIPLHALLARHYDESQHMDQFQLILNAAHEEEVLKAKDLHGYTPLSQLCSNRNCSSFPATITALLVACPEAASVPLTYGKLPIWQIISKCTLSNETTAAFYGALKLLFSCYPKAAVEVDSNGMYLLHHVAACTAVELVQMVHDAHPAASALTSPYGTPLHCAATNGSLEVVEYLYSLYPAAAKVTTADGGTCLHFATNNSLAVLKKVYSYYPEAITMKSTSCGMLPLHQLIVYKHGNVGPTMSTITSTETLEMLRFLLSRNPDAARVKDIRSHQFPHQGLLYHRKTEVAQRLILRAAPEVEPKRLRSLNYNARRGALYLLFAADISPPSMATSTISATTMAAAPVSSRYGTRQRGHREKKDEDARRAAARKAGETIPIIWRLLKGRADVELCKEITMYL